MRNPFIDAVRFRCPADAFPLSDLKPMQGLVGTRWMGAFKIACTADCGLDVLRLTVSFSCSVGPGQEKKTDESCGP